MRRGTMLNRTLLFLIFILAFSIFVPQAYAAPAFVKEVTSNLVVDGSASIYLTIPASGVAQGNTLIINVYKNHSTDTLVSVTDTRGNTYTIDANNPWGVGSSMSHAVASGYIATALQAGDTIAVNFGLATYSRRAAFAVEFSGIASSGRVD